MIAVLFARRDSVYKSFSMCDVFDFDRDARTWPGGSPVIAHPPCRAWGRLRHFAKPKVGERQLALFAVVAVQKFGGVLEHPEWSSLWGTAGLPLPGRGRDAKGGWTLPVSQKWWGHRAEKKTWLYIVGCEPAAVPPFPLSLADADFVISSRKRGEEARPCVTKAERERTPPEFARWLVSLAERCAPGRSRPTPESWTTFAIEEQFFAIEEQFPESRPTPLESAP
jgi:hypothetical protein